MPRRVELTTYLPCSPDEAWQRVQTSALLHHIAAPMLRFVPAGEPFPERWLPGSYRTGMLAFGVLPMGEQTIGIEIPPADGERRVLRDNGHGQLIRRWDHWIFIEPEGEGTRYTDRVDIDAGLLTPFVALFARVFYGHRQKRWRALAASDFRALEAR